MEMVKSKQYNQMSFCANLTENCAKSFAAKFEKRNPLWLIVACLVPPVKGMSSKKRNPDNSLNLSYYPDISAIKKLNSLLLKSHKKGNLTQNIT